MTPSDAPAVELADRYERLRDEYAGGADRPVGSYAGLMGIFGLAVAGLGVVTSRRRRPPPNGLSAADLALGAVATFRLSRLLTKDSVTAALRAPFTRFEEAEGAGEVAESVRGEGIRHAIGELITCPFCTGVWVATGFTYGFTLAPRAARLAAGALTMIATSDALQQADQLLRRAVAGDR